MGRITKDDRCLIMSLRIENCFARWYDHTIKVRWVEELHVYAP